jgi:triose/dihydroxyacetone kinase / FAD-AMP lyase (cyclizing)
VKAEGIEVRTVVANDDVPSAPKGQEAKRRGVAGEILMWKVGGAMAARGGSLDEVIRVAQKAIDNTRSIGIGLSACVIAAVGKANFSIAPGTMEVGIGHHGEPGTQVADVVSAADMAQMMVKAVLPDLPFQSGDRTAVLISGLGATPLMEHYILFGEIEQQMAQQGIHCAVNFVGNLFTSLEMHGITLTVMKLDDELESLLKQSCRSVGLTVHGAAVEQNLPKPPISKPHSSSAAPVVAVLTGQILSSSELTMRRSYQAQGATFARATAGQAVRDMAASIIANKTYLSEIDGLIGDGDHGINMAKGFGLCIDKLNASGEQAKDLVFSLDALSESLFDDIGGSMGPLYGRFFTAFANSLRGYEQVDASLYAKALAAGVKAVQSMGNAQVGDKTLIDTLIPALSAAEQGVVSQLNFAQLLDQISAAAEMGKESTKPLQARLGRSARLGERSIGVLDAGASSCALILQSMSNTLKSLIRNPS